MCKHDNMHETRTTQHTVIYTNILQHSILYPILYKNSVNLDTIFEICKWTDRHTNTIHHSQGHTHPLNGPLSGTTWVSRYQKGKTNLDFTEARDSGICWAIWKSAPRSRQITMPAPHHSVFYRPDALPATQPTASKHWRQGQCNQFQLEVLSDSNRT